MFEMFEASSWPSDSFNAVRWSKNEPGERIILGEALEFDKISLSWGMTVTYHDISWHTMTIQNPSVFFFPRQLSGDSDVGSVATAFWGKLSFSATRPLCTIPTLVEALTISAQLQLQSKEWSFSVVMPCNADVQADSAPTTVTIRSWCRSPELETMYRSLRTLPLWDKSWARAIICYEMLQVPHS